MFIRETTALLNTVKIGERPPVQLGKRLKISSIEQSKTCPRLFDNTYQELQQLHLHPLYRGFALRVLVLRFPPGSSYDTKQISKHAQKIK
mmetsp:Transcript_11455/g.24821  ORF Transcript_11455/g.24821 Transcript_11455/m.24821 type:complete len:90 (+) Transcript_11455:993-1262(+)